MIVKCIKRSSDVIAGVLGILFLSPILLLTYLLVKRAIGSPLFFVQLRSGWNGHPINLLKFRSMTNMRDETGKLLADDLRTPPVGHMIRRYRVDELPSLLNMIKGDISLVGPRPLLSTSEANIVGGQARLSVRPGLTGLAQISGNTLLNEREKLALDLYYIRNHSLIFDIEIIARTLLTVILGERRDETFIERAMSTMTGKFQ